MPGLMALQRDAGNQAVSRAVGEQGAGGASLLVDADAAPEPGQMTLSAFLDQVSGEVTRVATEALQGTAYSAVGCPLLPQWIRYFRQRPAAHVEQVVRRYAGTVGAGPRTAAEFVPLVGARVGEGLRGWLAGGSPPAPADFGVSDPPEMPVLGVPVLPFADNASGPKTAAEGPGPGRALDASVAGPMGRSFGADFGGVEVHTDSPYATEQGARAVTVGNTIAFAPGEYRPGSVLGDALIAHELAHVLQQRDAGPGRQALREGGDAGAVEADADHSAAKAMAALWGGAKTAAAEALPRLRSGLRMRRCTQPPPAIDNRPRYQAIVAELRPLYARKRAVLDGTEPAANLPGINARIDALVVELQGMGVRLGPDEIYESLEGSQPRDMLTVTGRIVPTPDGQHFWGQRLTYGLALDYVPEGRNVRVEWRWSSDGGGRMNQFVNAPGRGNHMSVELDDFFWSVPGEQMRHEGRDQLQVSARVFLGDETTPQATVQAPATRFENTAPASMAIAADPSVALAGDRVNFRIADWAPQRSRHAVDWEVDGQVVTRDLPVLSREFDTVGAHTVRAHLYEAARNFGLTRGRLLYTAQTSVTVQNQQTAGEALLAQSEPGALPALSGQEASITASIAGLERRVAAGGEQQPYWQDRLAGQRARLESLRRNAPGSGLDQPLPDDLSTCAPGTTYSKPIPATIVLPSAGGAQPIMIHLRLMHDGTRWAASFLDSTGRDVYRFDGHGDTPLAATIDAANAWHADHPYPRGGTVVHRFAPAGWTAGTGFETTTAWNTAKAWVDGILTVGGVIVAGILLLTPEPTTATKWLGAAILAASVARSAVAIYENISIGIPASDSRNVLEGVSILTSLLGVGGSTLRGLGINTIRPTMYRVGSWMVMSALAGDAGTLVFATAHGIDQIRLAQSDPSMDDGQRAMQTLRVIASLLNSGAMFFISNRDLVRQGIRRSDFLRTDTAAISGGARARAGAAAAAGQRPPPVTLETGARLDIAAELRAAGEPNLAARLRGGGVSDADLVDRHAALPWLRSGGLDDAGVAHMLLHLDTPALTALQDIPPARARAAVDAVGNGTAANRLATALRGAGLEAFTAARAATGSTVDVDTEPGLVRIDGIPGRAGSGLEISAARLAEITGGQPTALRELLEATRALAAAGGDPQRMPADLRARLDRYHTNAGGRLYFAHHRERGRAYLLTDLGVPATRFPNPSRRDLERLNQLANERTGQPMRDYARDYALSRNPANAAEFVEHFQYFIGEVDVRHTERVRTWRAERDRALDSWRRRHGATTPSGAPNAPTPVELEQLHVDALRAMFPPGTEPANLPPRLSRMTEEAVDAFLENAVLDGLTETQPGGRGRRLSATGAADVGETFRQRTSEPGLRVGSVSIPADTPRSMLAATLGAVAQNLGFGTQSSAAYHVLKHFREITPAERAAGTAPGGSRTTAYFGSVTETVRNPTTSRVETGQYGEQRVFFVRTEGGVTIRAIVVVTPDGRAFIATYGSGR
ncbi:hypothetical protein Afil01_40610 [Actinorhabdospora filicis]|uniref:eCIS core domain-containing protein n=1 Tax=Actinorhabdospora filicis TaxID=1785913 RepID=A0A9W6SNR9_9ACTN|nr:hypothetical protein Afil01_40610 [Actinorhabdospora filicis]